MSSALPPIVPAAPPSPRAPSPEDMLDTGAFERALGLASTAQGTLAALASAPSPPVAPVPTDATDREGTRGGSSAPLVLELSAADASVLARHDAAVRVGAGAPISQQEQPRIQNARASEPITASLTGVPVSLGLLPSVDASRQSGAAVRPAAGSAAAAPEGEIARVESTPHARPASRPSTPAPAQGVALGAPGAVHRGEASTTPATLTGSSIAVDPTSVAPALPAALALDVRVMAARIAPALRRGGLLEVPTRATVRSLPTSARPGLTLESGAEPVRSASAAHSASPSLESMVAASAGPLRSAAVPAQPMLSGPASAEPESVHAPAASAARTDVPVSAVPESTPQLAAPRSVTRQASQPVMNSDETAAERSPNEHGRRDTRTQASSTPPARARVPIVDAEARHDAPRTRVTTKAAAQAAQQLGSAGRTEATEAVEPATPALATEPAESAPVSVDTTRGARAVAVSAAKPAADGSTLERAEAALEARLSPARRAADQVTLRFEGEGGIEGRLRVSVRGDQVSARILALDAQTMERLAPELRVLQRALEEQGFRDARVSMQDLRATTGHADMRTDARTNEERRQGEPGRRQSGEERRGDTGPDGHRDRRGARDGRRAT